MSKYVTLIGNGTAVYTDRKSEFIGYAAHVETEEEAIAFISAIRKKHADARHNVYAYMLREGNITRYSDDGEPQGTAGIPVLDIIRKIGFTDAVIVVTRYFGGILLGTGGLVRAYSGAVAACLNEAKIVSNELSSELKVRLSYELYPVFLKFISDKKLCTLNSEFDRDVEITFVLPRVLEKSFTEGLTDYLLGRAYIEKTGEYFYSYGGDK